MRSLKLQNNLTHVHNYLEIGTISVHVYHARIETNKAVSTTGVLIEADTVLVGTFTDSTHFTGNSPMNPEFVVAEFEKRNPGSKAFVALNKVEMKPSCSLCHRLDIAEVIHHVYHSNFTTTLIETLAKIHILPGTKLLRFIISKKKTLKDIFKTISKENC